MSVAHDQSGEWATRWYQGRKVLITGGTSGIGAGLARGFLQAGADVTITGVTDAEVKAAADDPELGKAKVRRLDVQDSADIIALLKAQQDLDVLVNCAGVIRRGDELDPTVFESVVDINLNGTMRMCSAARPLLERSNGTILNLASMLSFFGGGLVPGYAASKGGIAQLTKSLAIAYAGGGIRVNAIAPGWIATPLTSALRANEDRSKAILDRTPLRRWGQPADLLGAVLYLCSPVASFVTGTVLVIDGGYAIT